MVKTPARIAFIVAMFAVLALGLIYLGIGRAEAPLAPASSPAVSASTASTPMGPDPHEALVDFIVANGQTPALLAHLEDDLAAGFRAQATFAAIERRSPGTIREMVTAMEPVIKQRSTRLYAEHHGELVALLRSGLSGSDAEETVRFFSSPTGRKLLSGVMNNYTMRETYTAMATKPDTNDAEVAALKERDGKTTKDRAIASFTPAERAEIERALTGGQWLLNFRDLLPKIQAFNARLENAPLSPAEQKALETIMARTLKKRGFKQP